MERLGACAYHRFTEDEGVEESKTSEAPVIFGLVREECDHLLRWFSDRRIGLDVDGKGQLQSNRGGRLSDRVAEALRRKAVFVGRVNAEDPMEIMVAKALTVISLSLSPDKASRGFISRAYGLEQFIVALEKQDTPNIFFWYQVFSRVDWDLAYSTVSRAQKIQPVVLRYIFPPQGAPGCLSSTRAPWWHTLTPIGYPIYQYFLEAGLRPTFEWALEAICSGSIEVLQHLIKEKRIPLSSHDKRLLWIKALERGSEAIVSYLLEIRWPVHVSDLFGATEKTFPVFANYLSERGIQEGGEESFIRALRAKNEKIIALLLPLMQSRIHWQNPKNGETLLMRACHYGHYTIATQLLAWGANPLAIAHDGQTALHCSGLEGLSLILSRLSTEEARDLLERRWWGHTAFEEHLVKLCQRSSREWLAKDLSVLDLFKRFGQPFEVNHFLKLLAITRLRGMSPCLVLLALLDRGAELKDNMLPQLQTVLPEVIPLLVREGRLKVTSGCL